MALFSNGPSAAILTQEEAIVAKVTAVATRTTAVLFDVPVTPLTAIENGFNFTVATFWSEQWVAHNSSMLQGNGSLQRIAEDEEEEFPVPLYSLAQSIVIGIVAVILFLITVVGNFMVMISFKMDKQLQTISNYFLLSLAVADFAIGLVSMPLYTIYLIVGYWPFGAFLCDSYLSLDYLLSNASVLNLLIISFDRYFSVTRPLTYRARRTTKRAIFMISCAWVISLILWPPWIFAWPYIEGKRTVEKHKCYIQFIKTNLYVTFGTAIAAFYIPVTVMCILYWRIWRETEKRQKDLTNLQAVKKDNSKRSTSSDDVVEQEEVNKRSRSDSSVVTVQASTMTSPPVTASTQTGPRTDVEIETTYVPTSMCVDNARYLKVPGRTKSRTLRDILCSTCYKYCKIDRDVPDYIDEDSTSDAGHGSPGNTTPASVETPVQSTVSRCTSLNMRQEPLTAVAMGTTTTTAAAGGVGGGKVRLDSMIPLLDRTATGNGVRGGATRVCSSATTTPAGPPPRLQIQPRSQSSDSVYTILIRLPLDNVPPAVDNQPSIRMIAEEEEGPPFHLLYNQKDSMLTETSVLSGQLLARRKESAQFERAGSQSSELSISGLPNVVRTVSEECSLHPSSTVGCTPAVNRRISQPPETIKLPLNTKLVPKQVVTKAAKKKKKKTQERKQDRKAAKTLSAILLAFIITWTPYNILVLVQTLATCGDECVPNEIWDLVYCLCYINSTVNPLCYALCNASFRRTYVRILTCKWHTKKRNPNRGYYN